MKTNETTPAASASRHTPEKWKSRGHEIQNVATGERIAVALLLVGETIGGDDARLAADIVNEHNALSGLNPAALPRVIDVLQRIGNGEPSRLAMMELSRAALAALKGGSNAH